MAEIGTRKIKIDDLDKLVRKIFSNSDSIALLERVFCDENQPAVFFDYLSKLSGDLSEWDKGRVFDNKSEIRWESEGDTFHVVWIVDDDSISSEWDKEKIQFVNRREILLWGEKTAGVQWYEKQVPRILKYPVKGSGSRAYAILNEYKLNEGSTVYRFKEVKAE
ncbi:MAG: hypothetical protein ACK415_05200 [Thermodesulfovibrionales bacterium]